MNGSLCARLALVASIALFVVAGAPDAAAQSSLDAAQAEDFFGAWAITIQSPDGDFPMRLNIMDAGGKVAARIGAGDGELDITDLSRSGEQLVARYLMDYEGMDIPVVVTLSREGDNLRSQWDFADGAYSTTAVGRKQ